MVGVGAHVKNVLLPQDGAQPVADRHRLFAPKGVRAAPLGVVHESDVDLKRGVWREGAEIQRLFVEERIADEPLASEPSVGLGGPSRPRGSRYPELARSRRTRGWPWGPEGHFCSRWCFQATGAGPRAPPPVPGGPRWVGRPRTEAGRTARTHVRSTPRRPALRTRPECVGEPTVLKGAVDGKHKPRVGGGGVDHTIPVGGEPEGEGGARSSRRKDRRGVPHGVAAGLGPALRNGDAPREDEQTDPAHDRPVRRGAWERRKHGGAVVETTCGPHTSWAPRDSHSPSHSVGGWGEAIR